MQSYSSAVDGKTLIRVGGSHGSKANTLLSNGTLHTAKSDLGLTMTSSMRPNLTSSSSSVNVTSSTISIGNASVRSSRPTSGSVTVKTATPQKKMTSIIDTKSGVVTSSIATVDPTKSPSAGVTSPSIVSSSPMISYGPVTPMDDVTMTLPNRSASTSSAKSTSILLTSTSIPNTPRDAEETSNLITSSIPMLSPVDVGSTTMTYPAPKLASSPLIISMPRVSSTSPIAMPTPSDPRSLGVIVATAEVHTHSTGVDSEDLRHDLDNEDRLSSVSPHYSVGSPGSKFTNPSEFSPDDDGSLVFTDDIDSQVYDGSGNRDKLPVPGAVMEGSHPAPNKNPGDPSSNPPLSPLLSIPASGLPSPVSILDPLITTPSSLAGSSTDATLPKEKTNTVTRSDSIGQDEPEANPASTFNFIGWDVGNMADKMADRKCHKVLIFKDSEIVLMFKASCVSEAAGNDDRLRVLMVDIAFNCAKRLKRMKDVALPKLQAEHMDSLPLTDERPTRQHLDDISRELNENVMINDVAFRFQPPDEDTYIGTYIDGSDAQSTDANCQIGRSGAVVVLKRKSRFASVESFSHQLCLHILSARPSSLGQISDLEVRRLRSTKTQLDPDKRQLLLFQDFLSDPSIIVAEAARRSFLSIQDYLLFG